MSRFFKTEIDPEKAREELRKGSRIFVLDLNGNEHQVQGITKQYSVITYDGEFITEAVRFFQEVLA